MTMQRVKRNCTTSGGKHWSGNRISSSTNKITKRKRFTGAQSTTETLLDENWGVRIAIFGIFLLNVFK
jgi:ribosomal protein L28